MDLKETRINKIGDWVKLKGGQNGEIIEVFDNCVTVKINNKTFTYWKSEILYKVKPVELWINVYEEHSGYRSGKLYDNEQSAKELSSNHPAYNSTEKITIYKKIEDEDK